MLDGLGGGSSVDYRDHVLVAVAVGTGNVVEGGFHDVNIIYETLLLPLHLLGAYYAIKGLSMKCKPD